MHNWTSGCQLSLDFDRLGSHSHGFGNWLVSVITADADGVISDVAIIEVLSTCLLIHERLDLVVSECTMHLTRVWGLHKAKRKE